MLIAVVLVRSILEVTGAEVASLAARAPRATALMLERRRDADAHGRRFSVDQRWVGYEQISPLLRRAVLVAEDDAFFSHDGLDWNEIRSAARRNLEAGRTVRGASTITQQLAKNLFLGGERSLPRKLKEALLALRIEHALSKRRIFELYLNEIEWGDGVFGAEAASQRYFGTSAADLDARQSILLAAVIINPRRYSPLRPSPRIERRVRIIAGRLHRRGTLDDDQYRVAIGEAPRPGWLQRWFGGGLPDTSGAPAPVDTTGP